MQGCDHFGTCPSEEVVSLDNVLKKQSYLLFQSLSTNRQRYFILIIYELSYCRFLDELRGLEVDGEKIIIHPLEW